MFLHHNQLKGSTVADTPSPDLELVGDSEFKALLAASDGLAARDAYSETRQRLELLDAGRAARKRAGFNQHQVAEQMGTRQSVVSNLERGVTDPRLGTLQKYGHAINSPLQISFGVPDMPTPPKTFASQTLARLLTKLTHQSSARQALNMEALVQALKPAPRAWTVAILQSLHEVGWTRMEVINDQKFYTLSEEAGVLIGLSLHGDRIQGALTNLAIPHPKSISHTQLELSDTTVETVIDVSVKVIQMLQMATPKPVIGVGVSVAGTVDVRNGKILYAPSLQSASELWRNVDFERALQSRIHDEVSTDIRVAVENDANSIGLADYLTTGADSTLVVLLSGVGIGASYVVDGKIIHGAHNAVSEIGHTVVAAEGPPCKVGFDHRGCLETVSSAAGMLTALNLPAETSLDVKRGLAELNARVSAGDGPTQAVLEQAGRDIGKVIGDAMKYLDPGRIKIFAHAQLIDPVRFRSAQSFRLGFDEAFEGACKQRLGFLPMITPEWEPLTRDTRANAAASAAFWHFLQTPIRWSPALGQAVKELNGVS